MRIVFMGTPAFSASILEELAQHHEVVAVYSRPDAVRGRGKQLVASPVKQAAERLSIEVRTPRTLRNEAEVAALAALEPEAVCVAAYGAILPPDVLAVPRLGCLNVHASLLPRWRGAAPIERAILAGDHEAGVCIMRMEEGLDTGAYCVRRSVEVGSMGAAELTERLAGLGAAALLTALEQVERGTAQWVEQDEAAVTYAEKIAKGELDLDPAAPALANVRRTRAAGEAHPSRAIIAGRGVTVLAACTAQGEAAEHAAGMAPGEVRFAAKRLLLGAADGAFEVLRVKPDGKQAMDAPAFAAGIQGIKKGGVMWEARHGA